MKKYLIKDGWVVDGTGSAAFKADILVVGKKIEAIGNILDDDAEVIDAANYVVCPGFIELHTHYDVHLHWDKYATPAPEHGVTTVITGNCSISLAPVKDDGKSKLVRMFKRIEDIDPNFFHQAVPFNWNSFPDYVRSFSNNIAINVGPLIGHTTLRHYVMGEAAQERAATPAELDRLCSELRGSILGGGFGLSMSYDHIKDENNLAVASSFASVEERVLLAKVVAECGRSMIQCSINPLNSELRKKQLRELADISIASGIKIMVLGVMENPIIKDQWADDLKHIEELNSQGAKLFYETQVRPLDINFKLSKNWIVAFYLPTWANIMKLPISDRILKFKDENLRQQLHEEMSFFSALMEKTYVIKSISSDNKKYENQSLLAISESENKTLTDALLDISLRDNLETVFQWKDAVHANRDIVSQLLLSPFTKISGSDAGAHVNQFSGEGDSTYLLEKFVKADKKITLEQAIRLLTSDIADEFGIEGRGRLYPGAYADIVIFDSGKIKRKDETFIYDIPGGEGRYYRASEGVETVFVNGEIVFQYGKYADICLGMTV